MSSQVLVSRDALERLLLEVYRDGNTRPNYCVVCYAWEDREHLADCPVPILRASLTPPAPAEDSEEIVRGLLDALTAVERYALPMLAIRDGQGLPAELIEKHVPAITAAHAFLALKSEATP